MSRVGKEELEQANAGVRMGKGAGIGASFQWRKTIRRGHHGIVRILER